MGRWRDSRSTVGCLSSDFSELPEITLWDGVNQRGRPVAGINLDDAVRATYWGSDGVWKHGAQRSHGLSL